WRGRWRSSYERQRWRLPRRRRKKAAPRKFTRPDRISSAASAAESGTSWATRRRKHPLSHPQLAWPSAPRIGGAVFTYRLHSPDADDLGEATYAVMTKPGEEVHGSGGEGLRV